MLALNGRRPAGNAEVLAYTDVLQALMDQGAEQKRARQLVARAIMEEEDTFRERWSNAIMDALHVIRTPFIRQNSWDVVQAKSCYGPELTDASDDGSLAAWVRDNKPLADDPPYPSFKLGRLLSSSLILDDLSPIYRAHLFHMLAFPLAGANVEPLELELARRHDFGALFEKAYLNRDPTCLPCHNSAQSVTPDFYPLPGLFEAALFGESTASKPLARYRSVFRVQDVLVTPNANVSGRPPWGWNDTACGGFSVPQVPDPLGIDASFGSVKSTSSNPQRGLRASVWDLEAALADGFEHLRGTGLTTREDGTVNPNDALAYLVSAGIVEDIWEEVMGAPLTISHGFPRTDSQRKVLESLTKNFIRSGYSLKSLLGEIVTHPLFNMAPPTEGCGAEPYGAPPVLNPWSIDEEKESERGNGFGDRVHHLPSRVLRHSLHQAMRWPDTEAFPSDIEQEEFQHSIGLFIGPFKPGFRGLGFQAMLSWEWRYGDCPSEAPDDHIVRLTKKAQETDGATLEDAVVALKDRLVGEAWIAPAERKPLEKLLGKSLKAKAAEFDTPALESSLRDVCGAYVVSPQFLLGGSVPRDSDTIPRLTLKEDDYRRSCDELRDHFKRADVGVRVDCLASREVAVTLR